MSNFTKVSKSDSELDANRIPAGPLNVLEFQ